MSASDIFELQAVVFAAVWCCRVCSIMLGVVLFRYVTLRSIL